MKQVLSRLALLGLLHFASGAQITTASKGAGGGLCYVGPYGWTCDPNDFLAAVPAEGAAPPTVPASYKAPVVLAAPKCNVSCVAGCLPPCPVACAEAKFKARHGSDARARTAHSPRAEPHGPPGSLQPPRSAILRQPVQRALESQGLACSTDFLHRAPTGPGARWTRPGPPSAARWRRFGCCEIAIQRS
jgi:hypothetical protein